MKGHLLMSRKELDRKSLPDFVAREEVSLVEAAAPLPRKEPAREEHARAAQGRSRGALQGQVRCLRSVRHLLLTAAVFAKALKDAVYHARFAKEGPVTVEPSLNAYPNALCFRRPSKSFDVSHSFLLPCWCQPAPIAWLSIERMNPPESRAPHEEWGKPCSPVVSLHRL